MMIARIEGCTRTCGAEQDFLGLPLRDEVTEHSVLGAVMAQVTAWTPTPEELAALNKGASVHVRIIRSKTNLPPLPPFPMMVSVGPIPL